MKNFYFSPVRSLMYLLGGLVFTGVGGFIVLNTLTEQHDITGIAMIALFGGLWLLFFWLRGTAGTLLRRPLVRVDEQGITLPRRRLFVAWANVAGVGEEEHRPAVYLHGRQIQRTDGLPFYLPDTKLALDNDTVHFIAGGSEKLLRELLAAWQKHGSPAQV